MWLFITLRHIVILVLFTFIVFGTGYTMADNHSKGGNFLDWLDGFFE